MRLFARRWIKQAFHEAIRLIWQVVADANRYVDSMAPWGLKKTDPARMGEVLAVLAETIRQVAILVQPVMPESASRILDQLGVEQEHRGFTQLAGNARIDAGVTISKAGTGIPALYRRK